MAKFQLEAEIGELMLLHYNYDSASMAVTSKSSTSLEIADMQGDRVVYSGSGFTFDGNKPTGGNVTKVEFFNPGGDLLLTISDAGFKLADLSTTDVLSNFGIFEKGKDTFTGSEAGDVILYGDNKGNDRILGLGGNDYIMGSAGKNIIDGGEGDRDVLTFSNIDYASNKGIAGINANLETGEVLNPWGKVDKVTGIEDVRGTKFADIFVGSDRNEFFSGLEGNDTFTGGGGNDLFEFSDGSDKDRIRDFGNGDDVVELYVQAVSTFEQLQGLMVQKGKNVVIDFGNGDVLTFLKFDKNDFVSDDFTIYDF